MTGVFESINQRVMKKQVLMISLFLFSSMALFSQNKNQTAVVEVDGICMMCKDRIEKAAIKNKGVKSAIWDVNSHQLSLVYDERKITLDEIEKSVANVGHDTENHEATAEVYENLHPCCKYRDEEVINQH